MLLKRHVELSAEQLINARKSNEKRTKSRKLDVPGVGRYARKLNLSLQ